ncbi:MAG: hypothetical protein ACC742_08245 [Thermoanaerobaculales bacterium]
MRQAKEVVEEFRLEKVLSTSPWSTVFLARDRGDGSKVVIKLVACGGPVARENEIERFHRVVEAAQALPGSSLARIHEFGITPDLSAYLVMDPVEGTDLASWRVPSPEQAVNLLLLILGSLEVLQSAGVSHLNLSIDNIFVTGTEKVERIHLLGFGTSAFLAFVTGGVWPDAEAVEVPPELRVGDATVLAEGWRGDLFSLAVIACRLLEAETEEIGSADPKVVLKAEVVDRLGEAELLTSVLARALRRDPAARAASLAEVRDALILALPAPNGAVEEESPQDVEPAMTKTVHIPVAEILAGEIDTEATTVLPSPVFNPAHTDPVPETALVPDVPPEVPAEEPAGTPPVGHGVGETAAFESPPIPEPSPEPIPVPEALPKPAPVATPAEVDPGGGGRPARWPVGVLAAAAVVAVVMLGIVTMVLQRPEREAPPEPVIVKLEPTPTAVPTVPVEILPEVDARLEAAQLMLLDGNLEAAREALQDFGRDEIDALSDEEREIYDEITGVAEGADMELAIRDLRGGLEVGSVRMLRRGVAGMSVMPRSEISAEPGLERDLARARQALRTHADLWDAKKNGDHWRVIEAAAKMAAILPDYSGAYQLRDEAAAALAAEAEPVIEEGNYEKAITMLERLQSAWPASPGVAERIAWCRTALGAERLQQATLASARAKGEAGDPEGGLRLLDEADVDPAWESRYAEARRRLETQLANLDAGYPIIELQEGFDLAFKKNQGLVVPLRVTDDYRVERVVVLARTGAGSEYREIQLSNAGENLYPFEVTPELHGNALVRFYVIAIDHSGHETRLGGPEGPLTIKRKKWFKK